MAMFLRRRRHCSGGTLRRGSARTGHGRAPKWSRTRPCAETASETYVSPLAVGARRARKLANARAFSEAWRLWASRTIRVSPMKVGVVVPFSWSYLGGVGEHAEAQVEALRALGLGASVIIGDDPPGSVSRLFHPDAPRPDARPADVISVGTTVTVPANGSRTHIVLNPVAVVRLRRLLREERFDVLHLH